MLYSGRKLSMQSPGETWPKENIPRRLDDLAERISNKNIENILLLSAYDKM
jgi:hypothetical protein